MLEGKRISRVVRDGLREHIRPLPSPGEDVWLSPGSKIEIVTTQDRIYQAAILEHLVEYPLKRGLWSRITIPRRCKSSRNLVDCLDSGVKMGIS